MDHLIWIFLVVTFFGHSEGKCPYTCWREDARQSYLGTASVTEEGYPCQRWDEDFPHTVYAPEKQNLPQSDATAAADYCRNPDNSAEGQWCYHLVAGAPGEVWKFCSVPKCGEDPEFQACEAYPGGVLYPTTDQPCYCLVQGYDCARNDLEYHKNYDLDKCRAACEARDDCLSFLHSRTKCFIKSRKCTVGQLRVMENWTWYYRVGHTYKPPVINPVVTDPRVELDTAVQNLFCVRSNKDCVGHDVYSACQDTARPLPTTLNECLLRCLAERACKSVHFLFYIHNGVTTKVCCLKSKVCSWDALIDSNQGHDYVQREPGALCTPHLSTDPTVEYKDVDIYYRTPCAPPGGSLAPANNLVIELRRETETEAAATVGLITAQNLNCSWVKASFRNIEWRDPDQLVDSLMVKPLWGGYFLETFLLDAGYENEIAFRCDAREGNCERVVNAAKSIADKVNVKHRIVINIKLDCSPDLPSTYLEDKTGMFYADLYVDTVSNCWARIDDQGLKFGCPVLRYLRAEVFCDQPLADMTSITLTYRGETFKIDELSVCRSVAECETAVVYAHKMIGTWSPSTQLSTWTLYPLKKHLLKLVVGCDKWEEEPHSPIVRISISAIHSHWSAAENTWTQKVPCYGDIDFPNKFCHQVEMPLFCEISEFPYDRPNVVPRLKTNVTVTAHQAFLCADQDCGNANKLYARFGEPDVLIAGVETWTKYTNNLIKWTLILNVSRPCCPPSNPDPDPSAESRGGDPTPPPQGCGGNRTYLAAVFGNKDDQCEGTFYNLAETCGIVATPIYCESLENTEDLDFIQLQNKDGETLTVHSVRLCSSTNCTYEFISHRNESVNITRNWRQGFFKQWKEYQVQAASPCNEASYDTSTHELAVFTIWDGSYEYSQCDFLLDKYPLKYCKRWKKVVRCRVFDEPIRKLIYANHELSTSQNAYAKTIQICDRVSGGSECEKWYSYSGTSHGLLQKTNEVEVPIDDNYREYYVELFVERDQSSGEEAGFGYVQLVGENDTCDGQFVNPKYKTTYTNEIDTIFSCENIGVLSVVNIRDVGGAYRLEKIKVCYEGKTKCKDYLPEGVTAGQAVDIANRYIPFRELNQQSLQQYSKLNFIHSIPFHAYQNLLGMSSAARQDSLIL